jgi:tRNA nucleotidyltransferase/poly(A) polymerase
MHDLSSSVSSNALLGSIQDLLPGNTFLVGGSIRDLLLGREPLDYDLVTDDPVERLAEELARRLGSRPFWMDAKRGVLRIVLKQSGVSIDIAQPKGPDIGTDLMARDLTINAMARDMATGAFLDPSDGMGDLKNGLVRIISEKNLVDDPLRALRAIRFSVTLNFALHEDSSLMIRKHRDLLRQASPERIRLEFTRSLDAHHSARFFRLLTWLGLVPVLFPPGLVGTSEDSQLWHPGFSIALPMAEELDQIIYAADALMPGSRAVLGEETEREVKRSVMLRLAAFLLGLSDARQAGTPELEGEPGAMAVLASDFCAGLRFSTSSCRMVRGSLENLAGASSLLSNDHPAPLDLYRFCHRADPALPEAVLLSLARTEANGKERRQAASALWEYFRSTYREYRSNPLVTGRDVMAAVQGATGPAVGRLLEEVEEARAQGIVGTRNEALEYLHGIAL